MLDHHFLCVYQSVDKAISKLSISLPSYLLPSFSPPFVLSSLFLLHFEYKLKFYPCFTLKIKALPWLFLLICMNRSCVPSLFQQNLTSHCPCAAWFLSCIFQSSVLGSAQWCIVRMTGRVSRAPGGPQLTTGVKSVWVSSMSGLGGEQRTASLTFP